MLRRILGFHLFGPLMGTLRIIQREVVLMECQCFSWVHLPAGTGPKKYMNRRLQYRKKNSLILNWPIQRRGANAKNPTVWWCRSEIIYGKVTRHPGMDGCVYVGSWLVRSEARVMNHFYRSWRQLWGLFWHPSVQSHGKVTTELFHLRAQELKHNLGQDIIFSLPEVWTVWPLSGLGYYLLLPCSGVVVYLGEKLDLIRGGEK